MKNQSVQARLELCQFMRRVASAAAPIALLACAVMLPSGAPAQTAQFKRIATFPAFENFCAGQDAACADEEVVAEIVAASEDGNLLIYTDSANEVIGFVDITNPADPKPAGILEVGGEPTSVAVVGQYALAAVNTSDDYVNTSGHLNVIYLPTKVIVRTIDLGGQPDSVAVSKSGRFAAVAIENERNEDACVGGAFDGQEADEDDCENGGGELGVLPQLPAGFLVIVDLQGSPALWSTRKVALTGLAEVGPADPEPEYVAINDFGVAAVTLQENNHIVLVDLATGGIVKHFSAGSVDLTEIDTEENDLIEPVSDQPDRLREPDAVTWISPFEFVTADEGDLDGGSRTFTIFRPSGAVAFDPGNAVEHLITRIGHYPEDRSENKGNEPEGVAYGVFGGQRFLFVGSERSSVVLVYQITGSGKPEFFQVLPSGVGPEGLLPIPQRNLFVIANEADDRGDKFRAALNIYEYDVVPGAPSYPTVISADRPDGTPIPWAALSALAGDPVDPRKAYTVYDSFFDKSRIFTLDVSGRPAVITGEIVLHDAEGNTFNLDPEGLAVRPVNQGFWVASEGAGSVDDAARPVTSKDVLLEVAPDGLVRRIVELPEATNALQRRFGFEGVTSVGIGDEEVLYVAFQREWVGDPARHVRIGRYQVATGEWTFYYYPLDPRESPFGGWVGLSEIVALDAKTLAILERDNQGGPDARIKRIYKVSIEGVTPQPEGGEFPVLTKTLVRDILPDMAADNGLLIEKVEGLGVQADGTTFIVTDNDGVDDSSGETQLINLGKIF